MIHLHSNIASAVSSSESAHREKMRERLRSEMSEEDPEVKSSNHGNHGSQEEEYVGGLQEGLKALSW